MSYYANEVEDDILIAPKSPTNHRGSTRRSGSKRRSSSKKSSRRNLTSDDEGDVVEDDIVLVGTAAGDENDDDRQQQQKRRSSKSRERKAKLRAKNEGSSRMIFSKKKGRKSRRDQVYDDLYGTDYQEVDDGIVGCADGLCVGGAGVLEDGIDLKTDNTTSTSVANSSKRSALLSSSSNTAGSKSKGRMSMMSSPNTGEQNKVDENEEVYVVRQRYGYFSIFFGVIQIIVLALMMWQCGIAPMDVNPMFGPYPDALSEWGGKNSVLIVEDGEWWRLMTPILLHAGVIHLVCNVAVQLELGVFFEREWGSMTWLIIYFTSALGSSVLSVITMPDAVSVGSSGAVMGLFGGKLAEVICRSCEKQDTAQDRVAHQVRKEQCLGVTCSVVVVMAFSFIPYGKSIVPSFVFRVFAREDGHFFQD